MEKNKLVVYQRTNTGSKYIQKKAFRENFTVMRKTSPIIYTLLLMRCKVERLFEQWISCDATNFHKTVSTN